MRARSDEAKDERRQAMMMAALDVFFERGFTAARMEDIAARAGVSKGAVYLYFDSKQALFSELIKAVAPPNIAMVEKLADAAPSAAAALRAMAGAVPKILRDTPLERIAKVIIADAQAFPEVVSLYRHEVVGRALGLLERILRRGRDAGEFEVEDPALFARLVAAPIVFSAVWRVVFERNAAEPDEAPLDVEALFDLHIRNLLRALQPGAGGPVPGGPVPGEPGQGEPSHE